MNHIFKTVFSLTALVCVNALAHQDHAATAPEKAESAQQAAIPYAITTDIYPLPPKQPSFGPGEIQFVDTDPSDAIGGTLMMKRAVNAEGERLDEAAEGITTYMVHWGLEVGEPGIDDNVGAGDHGGDCRGFRDTGHVVMKAVADLDDSDVITWDIPAGTEVPKDAVYFVGHTLYGPIHNIGQCAQLAIDNQN